MGEGRLLQPVCGRGFVSLFMKLDGMSDEDLTY